MAPSILLAAPPGSALEAELDSLGEVARLRGGTLAALRAGRFDYVVTAGPRFAGYALQRRGATWVIDARELGAPAAGRLAGALEGRLLRAADAVSVAGADAARDLHARSRANVVALAPAEVLRRRDEPESGGGPRVLMLGPVNHQHVIDLALALRARGAHVEVAGYSWPLAPTTLAEDGVRVHVALSPVIPWLRRLVRRVRPDVVHAHWLPLASTAWLARARPLVVHAWGSDVYDLRPRDRPLARRALGGAEAVLADSNDLIDELVRLGAPRERTRSFNWGVDLERFRPASPEEKRELKASFGLGPGPLVLSPRGQKELYSPDTVIAAWARVAERVPDTQLVVKHFDRLTPALEAAPHRERVHVIGRVDSDRVADLLRAADVCVSIPTTDSSPRTVWEAMACGCPCVLSDLPWVDELIERGADALVVPIEAGAVADACERVLTDTAIAAGLAARGRALAERHRDQEAELGRLLALYAELAARSPSAGR